MKNYSLKIEYLHEVDYFCCGLIRIATALLSFKKKQEKLIENKLVDDLGTVNYGTAFWKNTLFALAYSDK